MTGHIHRARRRRTRTGRVRPYIFKGMWAR